MKKVYVAAVLIMCLLLSCVAVGAAPADPKKKTEETKVKVSETIGKKTTISGKVETSPIKREETAAKKDEAAAEEAAKGEERQAEPEEGALKQGMRGERVQMLQKLLAERGYYSGSIDGIFGKITLGAVKEFQAAKGLEADGIAGKETVMYLEREKIDFNPSRASRSLVMSASAYSAYDPGNSNYTARGNVVRKGLVAVDPNVIPLGTRLYVAGYGYAVADDIGGAIKGNRIDLAFESHADAMQFGRQRVTVYILD